MAPRVCWRCAAGYGLQDTVRTAREQSQKIKIDRMPERWPWLRIRPNRHARRLRATACCVGGRLLRRAAGDRGTARAVRGVVGTAGGRGAGCSGESRGTEERAPRGSSNGVHPSAHDPRRSRWRRTCRAWRRACSWTLRPPRRARTAAWAAAARAPASTDPRARARGRVTEGGASLATAGCCSTEGPRSTPSSHDRVLTPIVLTSFACTTDMLALNPTLWRSPPCNRRRTARGRPSHRRCGRRQRWRRRCLSLGWPSTCQTILRRPMHPRPAQPSQAAAVSPGSAQQTGDSR